MKAAKTTVIVLILFASTLLSCRSGMEPAPGNHRQMRQRAVAKRAHAAGLRTDAKDIDHTIDGARQSMAALMRRVEGLESRIRDLETSVRELEAQRDKLAPREAYAMRITVRRWQTGLDTVKHQRDTLRGHIRSIEYQIREQENIRNAHVAEADRLESRAAELELLAAEWEGKEPAPEKDFWSLW